MPIRHDNNGSGIYEHAKCIPHGFVVCAVNADLLVLYAVAIAVLAEEHAVPETFGDPFDVRRDVENACGEKHLFAAVSGFASPKKESAAGFP